jgi:DNA-binding MarR family transcriptional regulator
MRRAKNQPTEIDKATEQDLSRCSDSALNLDRYIPAQINFLASKISASATAVYLPKFGIGITAWRIMAQLAHEPWVGASHICQVTGMDKGAVSRSLRELEARQLIEIRADAQHGRRLLIALTEKGVALHDTMVNIAVAREQYLLQGFSESEVEQLSDFLRRMRQRIELSDETPED